MYTRLYTFRPVFQQMAGFQHEMKHVPVDARIRTYTITCH